MLAVPVSADPMVADPVVAVPLPAVPVVDPVSAVPPGVLSVGLVLALPEPPPETAGLDAGGVGVEELLPGVDEGSVAVGLAEPGGLVAGVEHGVPVAVADVLPPFALPLAFAEAAEVAVLMAVAVAVPEPVPVDVAVAVALPAGLLLVLPLGGLLAEFSGDALGDAELAGVALTEAADEVGAHAVADAPLWVAEVPL